MAARFNPETGQIEPCYPEKFAVQPFPSLAECRSYARRTLRGSADRLDETGNHETAAMLRYAADDLKLVDEVMRQRDQNHFLYDQWGLRIVACENTEPHDWHGWTSANHDVRCPGVRG